MKGGDASVRKVNCFWTLTVLALSLPLQALLAGL